MPTCFQHFCAEWRRARRVLLLNTLDLETKRELAAVLAGDSVVGCDGPLAEKFNIGFWHADLDEATAARLWLAQTGAHVSSVANDEVDTNDGEVTEDGSKQAPRVKTGQISQPVKGFAKLRKPGDIDREASFSWSQQASIAVLGKNEKLTDLTLLFRNPDHPMAHFPDECGSA